MPVLNETTLQYQFQPSNNSHIFDPASEKRKEIKKERETQRKYDELLANQRLLNKITQDAEKEKQAINNCLINRMAYEFSEANNECKFIKPKEAEQMLRKHYQQEEEVAFALRESKLAKITELKTRQLIHESMKSDKLREMKRRLNLGFIAKENAAQRRETQVIRALQNEYNASIDHQLRQYQNFQNQVEKEYEIEKGIEKMEELREQQQSLVCKEKLKQKIYENELTCRELAEGAELISWNEDYQEIQKKKRSYQSYQNIEKNAEKTKEIWKEYENNLNNELEESINKFAREKYLLEEQRQNLQHQIEQGRALTHERLSRVLYEDSMKAFEKEDVLLAYDNNRFKQQIIAKENAERELRLKQRYELIETARVQRQEREERAVKAKEVEAAYAAEVMHQVFLDKKRISDEKETLRQKALANVAVLDQQVAEKRLRKYENMLIEAKILDIQFKGEADRVEGETNECRRLLLQHGEEICDYIPPGTLAREDIALLGAKAQARFNK